MAQLNNVMKYPTTYYKTKDIPQGQVSYAGLPL